jgi:hypothetical protein
MTGHFPVITGHKWSDVMFYESKYSKYDSFGAHGSRNSCASNGSIGLDRLSQAFIGDSLIVKDRSVIRRTGTYCEQYDSHKYESYYMSHIYEPYL